MFFALALFCMWLARRRLISFTGKWKFWLAGAVFAIAATFQSYVVVSRMLWPSRDVLFSVSRDGVRCVRWQDRVVPLNQIQNITTMSFGKWGRRTHWIDLHLSTTAPRYTDEIADIESHSRLLRCDIGRSVDPADIDELPTYWKKVARQ